MPLPEEQFSPAPASPASVPGVPDTVGMEEMPQEEMVSNLEALMEKINNKYQEFSADKFSTDTKIKQSKSESLRQVFDLLQSVGIDPSNVEQVKGFLDKIRENNPELYQQVESALRDIIEGEVEDEAPMAMDNGEIPQDINAASNMNINNPDETSQENI